MREVSKIIDDLSDADYICGGEDFIITDEDIEMLKQGNH